MVTECNTFGARNATSTVLIVGVHWQPAAPPHGYPLGVLPVSTASLSLTKQVLPFLLLTASAYDSNHFCTRDMPTKQRCALVPHLTKAPRLLAVQVALLDRFWTDGKARAVANPFGPMSLFQSSNITHHRTAVGAGGQLLFGCVLGTSPSAELACTCGFLLS